jgi:hypothetical protein
MVAAAFFHSTTYLEYRYIKPLPRRRGAAGRAYHGCAAAAARSAVTVNWPPRGSRAFCCRGSRSHVSGSAPRGQPHAALARRWTRSLPPGRRAHSREALGSVIMGPSSALLAATLILCAACSPPSPTSSDGLLSRHSFALCCMDASSAPFER